MFGTSIGPPQGNGDSALFLGPWPSPSVVVATGWKAWIVPRNASFVNILCVGGGGAGGSGNNTGTGIVRCGGGGGGSGAASRLLIEAGYLPPVLYVLAGSGGAATVNTGTNGGPSMVCDRPISTVAANRVLMSGSSNTVGGGGGGFGDTSVGTGGNAEGVAVATGSIYSGFGIWTPIAGQAGAQSGAATGGVGGSIAIGSVGAPLSAGAGGGSVFTTDVAQAGGDVTGAGSIATLSGGVAPSGFGQQGWNGILNAWRTGGSGGASVAGNGSGGNGGGGGWGCGGGGGGGGEPIALFAQGSAGHGGRGFVLITWW